MDYSSFINEFCFVSSPHGVHFGKVTDVFLDTVNLSDANYVEFYDGHPIAIEKLATNDLTSSVHATGDMANSMSISYVFEVAIVSDSTIAQRYWNKLHGDYYYLSFAPDDSLTEGVKVELNRYKTSSSSTIPDLEFEYSTNMVDWYSWVSSVVTLHGVDNVVSREYVVGVGERFYVRNASETSTGLNKNQTSSQDGWSGLNSYVFEFSNKIHAYGNINSLLCKNTESARSATYCFCCLFYLQSNLITAPKIKIKNYSATSDSTGCCWNMFRGCTNLVNVPVIYIRRLGTYCFGQMFWGCSKLKELTVIVNPDYIDNPTSPFSNWINATYGGTIYYDMRCSILPALANPLYPSTIAWTIVDINE